MNFFNVLVLFGLLCKYAFLLWLSSQWKGWPKVICSYGIDRIPVTAEPNHNSTQQISLTAPSSVPPCACWCGSVIGVLGIFIGIRDFGDGDFREETLMKARFSLCQQNAPLQDSAKSRLKQQAGAVYGKGKRWKQDRVLPALPKTSQWRKVSTALVDSDGF